MIQAKLAPSSRRILWLVGQQRAGKTMLATIMGSCGAHVINIGETLRRDISVGQFLADENPYAPGFVEDTVQEMIRVAIHELESRSHGILIIDSAPRNSGQLSFLVDHQEISTVIFVLEDYEIRRGRARQKYGNDLTLFEKREAFEREWLAEFAKTCDEFNISNLVFPGGSFR
jgi:hypothetical protein